MSKCPNCDKSIQFYTHEHYEDRECFGQNEQIRLVEFYCLYCKYPLDPVESGLWEEYYERRYAAT